MKSIESEIILQLGYDMNMEVSNAKPRSESQDARGVPVSCSQQSALDLFETALVQYQTYVGDPLATIDDALRHAPDFILGHLFRAALLMTTSEKRFAIEARA